MHTYTHTWYAGNEETKLSFTEDSNPENQRLKDKPRVEESSVRLQNKR